MSSSLFIVDELGVEEKSKIIVRLKVCNLNIKKKFPSKQLYFNRS